MALRAVPVAVLLVLVVAVADAAAWTASREGARLVVGGDVRVNQLVVADDAPDTVAVSDDATAFEGTIPPGCSDADPDDGQVAALQCSTTEFRSVLLSGAGGADDLTAATARVASELRGEDGDDRLVGGVGGDVLDGGTGDDRLDGGEGSDQLDGREGTDEIVGSTGDDRLVGGSGNDRLDGGDGADALAAQDNDDELLGGPGNDVLDAGAGNDVLLGDEGDDLLSGDVGADRLDGGFGRDLSRGGDGDDVLEAADGRDRLAGEDGSDQLASGPTGAELDGGPGADLLQGADGPDVLAGGDGADRLLGEDGADTLDAGAGDDSLEGGTGPDRLGGGPGADRVSYEFSATGVTVTLAGGADDGASGEGDDVAADIEQVRGTPGDDRLVAASTPASLVGDDGADTLIGGSSADVLDGGPGDDRLDGASGGDRLLGGDEFDTVDYGGRRAAVSVRIGDGRAADGQRGEGDEVDVSVETIIGGSSDDVLSGARGLPVQLVGNAGDDRLFVVGSSVDPSTLRCGAGNDRAHGLNADVVGVDCESVWRVGIRTRYGVARAGRPTLLLEERRLSVRRGQVRLRLRCLKNERSRCRGVLTLAKRGRGLARRRVSLLPGVTSRLTVRLTDSGRRLLRRYRSGTLVLTRVTVGSGQRRQRLIASLPLTRPR